MFDLHGKLPVDCAIKSESFVHINSIRYYLSVFD